MIWQQVLIAKQLLVADDIASRQYPLHVQVYLGLCLSGSLMVLVDAITRQICISLNYSMMVAQRHSCYGWKWYFLAKKHYTIQKNIHNSAKTYGILLKYKGFESLRIWFHSSYGWKWYFLAKKHYTIQKNIHNSAKTYGILLK